MRSHAFCFMSWAFCISSVSMSMSDAQGNWSSVPGSFRVLEGTKAEFRWIHTIPGYVHITWYYRGSVSEPVVEPIMFFANNKITIPKTGNRHSRLDYDSSTTGSAIMMFDDVRITDTGNYEAKVEYRKHIESRVLYIQDVSHMEVIQASGMVMHIMVDNTTQSWSLVDNDIDLWLPLQTVPYPHKFRVFVKVDDQAPPPSIQMEVLNEKGSFKEPECHGYSCLRYMDPWYSTLIDRTTPQQATLIWSVGFAVQNLDQIRIRMKVIEEMEAIGSTEEQLEQTTTAGTTTEKLDEGDPIDKPEHGLFSHYIIISVIVGLLSVGANILLGMKYCSKKEMPEVNPTLHDIVAKDLDKHAVPSSQLETSAYGFMFTLDFKKPIFLTETAEKTVCCILAAITALLNTSGGIVTINHRETSVSDSDEATSGQLNNDETMKFIRAWLSDFHSFSVTNKRVVTDHIYQTYVGYSVTSTELQFNVKVAPQPVTYKYNTYTRDIKGRRPVLDIETVRNLIKSDMQARPDNRNPDITNKERFADVTDNNDFKKELVSMANVCGGGYIRVHKPSTNISQMSELGELLPLVQTTDDWLMKLYNEQTTSSSSEIPSLIKERDWYVVSKPEDHVMIKVTECENGAFWKNPKCFYIGDCGHVVELSFQNWKRFVMGHPIQRDRLDTHQHSSTDPLVDSPSHGHPSTKVVADDHYANHPNESVQSQEMQEQEGPEILIWGKSQERSNQIDDVIESTTLRNINKADIFKMKRPPLWSTRTYLCNILKERYPEVTSNFAEIDLIYKECKGWILAFNSILRGLGYQMNNVSIPKGHILDILICTEERGMELALICSKGAIGLNVKEYGNIVGRFLKKSILECAMFENRVKISLHIDINVYRIPSKGGLDNHNPQGLPQSIQPVLNQSLGILLYSSNTYIRGELEEEFAVQGTVTSTYNTSSAVNLAIVDGPPGSLSTYHAATYASTLSKEHLNVYFVTPSNLCKEIQDFLNECKVITQQELTDLPDGLLTQSCVVIDQGEKITNQNVWYSVLESTKHSAVCIFLSTDSNSSTKQIIQGYAERHGIEFVSRNLFKGHQTSRLVALFVNAVKGEIFKSRFDTPLVQGDNIYLHLLPPSYKFMSHSLLEYLEGLRANIVSGSLDSTVLYKPEDIVVLFDKQDGGIIRSLVASSTSFSETSNEENKVVVDTTERLNGLTSKVVVFVLPSQMTKERMQGIHKWLLASRVIRRIDFVYQGEHRERIKNMLGFPP